MLLGVSKVGACITYFILFKPKKWHGIKCYFVQFIIGGWGVGWGGGWVKMLKIKFSSLFTKSTVYIQKIVGQEDDIKAIFKLFWCSDKATSFTV